MAKMKITPCKAFTNFLRTYLTDVNSNRSGQWIFPDFPRVSDLGDSSFPRIGVTEVGVSGELMGLGDNDFSQKVTLQVDIITKKDLFFNVSFTDESLGTMVGTVESNRFTFNNVPNSITDVKHGSTAFSASSAVSTNSGFTSSASLGAGTVEWSLSTGDLNFASADIVSYTGEDLTSSYVVGMEGKKLVKWLGLQVVKNVRNYWRVSSDLNGMYHPVLLSAESFPFDEDLGLFRFVVEYQFEFFNYGEGL